MNNKLKDQQNNRSLDALTDSFLREEIDVMPGFTARVMSRVNEREQKRWFALPSVVYSFVFIVVCLLGLLLNPNWSTEKETVTPGIDQSAIAQYTDVLAESQQMALLEVQDQTLEMVYKDER